MRSIVFGSSEDLLEVTENNQYNFLFDADERARATVTRWFNDGFKNTGAETFEERFQAVKEHKYFCWSKPQGYMYTKEE